MKQYLVDEPCGTEKKLVNEFVRSPNLVYVSKVDEEDIEYPRVMHAHQDLVEILLITSGAANIFIQNCLYPVTKGDMIIYNSNVIHDEQLRQDKPISLFCCGFTNLQIKGLRNNALIYDDRYPVFSTNQHYGFIKQIYQLMFTVLKNKEVSYATVSNQLFMILLLYVRSNIIDLSVKVNNHEQMNLIREIKIYLDNNFTENVQLKTIEKKWGISRYYFSHQFKSLYGYSPTNYLIRRKIGEAQTLLLTTNLSVTTIATNVGFNNLSYFNRLFKKFTSLSPKDYRKKYLFD
ncbi:helix-turn-helix transcriptional regulator [Bacillaceae bacterium Marseille-Q3522]|nr:helix-turn-helix transcriptional regulator [Bacillaceae bacterium Marseille-Q3522]